MSSMVHHAVFPSLPASPRRAREFVRERLAGTSCSDQAVRTLELVVSELVANAVEHGSGDDIVVDLGFDNGEGAVTLAVRSCTADVDAGFPSGPFAVPTAEQRSGRGLAMVRSLVDTLWASLDGRVLTVQVALRVTG